MEVDRGGGEQRWRWIDVEVDREVEVDRYR